MRKRSIGQCVEHKALSLHDLKIREGISKQIYDRLRKEQDDAYQPRQDKKKADPVSFPQELVLFHERTIPFQISAICAEPPAARTVKSSRRAAENGFRALRSFLSRPYLSVRCSEHFPWPRKPLPQISDSRRDQTRRSQRSCSASRPESPSWTKASLHRLDSR